MNDRTDANRPDNSEPKYPEHVDRPNAVPAKPSWRLTLLEWCIFSAIAVIFAALALRVDWSHPNYSPSAHCSTRLLQIGHALHNYHSAHDCFPPAYIADENGKPMHSWRVLILPYFQQSESEWRNREIENLDRLYAAYDFSKPWDHPANRDVLEQMPVIYRCPTDTDANPICTSYAGAFGPNCFFQGTEPTRIQDFTDGLSETIAAGEMRKATIPWTKPQDVDVQLTPRLNQQGGFGARHGDGCQILFASGSRTRLSERASKETLRKLFQRNDGEVIGDDEWRL
jgi:hypothetical protein